MRDTARLLLRMLVAFAAIVFVLSLAQRWDDADSARISAQMRTGS